MKITILKLLLLLLIFPIIVTAQMGPDDKGSTDGMGPKEEKKVVATNLTDGFQNIAWSTTFTEARKNVKGQIVYENEKKFIVTKDGNITYRYGFFFIDPELAEDMTKAMAEDKSKEGSSSYTPSIEAKLFYGAMEFPYLHMDDVKKRLIDKYGKPTAENIKKNTGAIVWESEKSVLIMWVDRYEKKPYCRKLNYLSKEISKEVNKYHHVMFNKVELKIIREMNP